jgi:hypothetical protein
MEIVLVVFLFTAHHKIYFIIFLKLISIFSSGTGVWTQVFMIAKQVLYCLSHTHSPYCSGYFREGSKAFAWAELKP